MNTGKVSENIIKRSILKYTESKGAGSIRDCALFTGFVTDEKRPEAGAHAMIRAINRAAEAGKKPTQAAITVSMPQNMREKLLREIVINATDTAAQYDIYVTSGHSHTVEGLKYPIVTVSLTAKEDIMSADSEAETKVRPGDSVVMTKWAGIYGSSWIATEHGKGPATEYPEFLIKEAAALERFICVREEAQIAHKLGIHHMYACSDGGVFAGLWKLADRNDVGICADLKAIPIMQETVEMCEYYDINPYKLSSDGALLIVTDRADELIEALIGADIPSAVIGHITEGHDKTVISGEEKRYLDEPTQDEQIKVLCYTHNNM